ncbi:hypothetical protein [[Clostridium] colinum]|uniref:hypothetical protein n=1 Tax=[Clostridium] colinum TaxID=36835 RepID=UPI002023ED55|nr:hypothetical protein [[Clostridium] colinum]
MCTKNKKQQEVLVQNVFNLSLLTRKLSLYCNFLSKSKILDRKYIKSEIENIKLFVESIEKYL